MNYKITIIIWLMLHSGVLNFTLFSQNGEVKLLQNIQNHQGSGLRQASECISETAIPVAIGTPVVLTIGAFVTHDEQMLKNAIYASATLGVNTLLTYGLKYAFKRPRPYDAYPDLLQTEQVRASYAFPSGHTSIAFSTATALTISYPKWYIAVPSYLWAISVGYSRMSLTVHYPSDVVAGAVLGCLSAYLTHRVNHWCWQKKGDDTVIKKYLSDYF